LPEPKGPRITTSLHGHHFSSIKRNSNIEGQGNDRMAAYVLVFGRRLPRRVEAPVIPASENPHMSRRQSLVPT
jgi:hypothetical protein